MNNSRRTFVKNSALALAGAALLPKTFFAAPAADAPIVGVQLYSVRDDMKAAPLKTLQALAKMGYKNVEHANYENRKFYGYSADEFKKVLSDLGMKMPSGHTVMRQQHWDAANNTFTPEWIQTVEDAATVGQEYVISPWLDDAFRKSTDDLKRFMDVFNKSDHLQAPVFFIGPGKRNHHAQQLVGEHKLVFIPIAIILVPFPSAAHPGFFLHQLGVKMTNRGQAVQQLRRGVHHSFAAGEVAKYIVAWCEPKRQPCFFTALVIQVQRVFPHGIIFERSCIKCIDFRSGAKFFYHHITIGMIRTHLFGR